MKWYSIYKQNQAESRSREGAWIEINVAKADYDYKTCRSREGAWIEIASLKAISLAMQSLP